MITRFVEAHATAIEAYARCIGVGDMRRAAAVVLLRALGAEYVDAASPEWVVERYGLDGDRALELMRRELERVVGHGGAVDPWVPPPPPAVVT